MNNDSQQSFQAYIKGSDAYEAGLGLHNNPYKVESNLWHCWNNGFLEMKEFCGDYE